MRSLRRTLVLATAGSITAVLLAAGTLVYVLARSKLVEQFDHSLADKARLLASTIEQETGKIELEFDELDMGEFQHAAGPGYLQLWRSDGSGLYRSASLGVAELQRTAGSAMGSAAFQWITLPNGRTGRAVEITVQPRLDEAGREPPARPPARTAITLVLARDAGSLHAALNSLKGVLLGVGLAAVALSSVVLWLAIRRGLAPLDEVADEIGRLGDNDLARRIRARAAPQELQPVINRLNDLLGRLEAAFQRERSFSADVAHELRTPLGGLRATMEVALSKTRQPQEYEQAIHDCLRTALAMQAMTEGLLSLGRLESGQVDLEPEWIVPDELVQAAWQPLEEQTKKRKLQVRFTEGAKQAIRTDPTLLRLVIGNIMENAVIYADEGGTVEIQTTGDDHAARLRVANSGSAVCPEQTEMVFDRFWRGDAARSAAGVRSGLGLALVKRAASVLGGRVEVTSTPGGQFQIAVSIPSLQDPPPRTGPPDAGSSNRL